MHSKSTQLEQIAQQLSEVGVYNQQVFDFIKRNSKSLIIRTAIKVFEDSAQRRNLSDLQYNKEVEEFNSLHGFYIPKRGLNYQTPKDYNYINYPYLDREAVRQTMANYKNFVATYNNKTVADCNKDVATYNKTVATTSNKQILSAIQDFKDQYNKDFTNVYNKAVEDFNDTHGQRYLKKRRLQKIKYHHEITMHVIVGFYVKQLKQRNLYLLQSNRSTKALRNDLPRVKIDHRKLASHNIEGVTRLDYCKKTAQNHVKRLREAGILTNYLYINQNKPISVNINPEILVVLDGKSPKRQIAQNQLLNCSTEKTLHDSNESTSAFSLKRKEIKDFPIEKSNKCGSMQESLKTIRPADSYKNTTEENRETSPEARAEIQKILPNFLKGPNEKRTKPQILADNFRKRLVDSRDLAKQLADGNYDGYSGLDYAYLEKVALYASEKLTIEEFKQVLIQDFIKISSKIWKNHTVYVGEWKKTINYLNTELLKNITRHETMIKKIKEYRWKINFARQWFMKNEVSALFPYEYFNVTRKKSNELGFFGLHSVWKSHLKYQEKKKSEEQKQKVDAASRKRRLTDQKKLTKAIQKYESGVYDHKQLYNYVQDNLPHNYLAQLGNLLSKNTNYSA